MWCFTLLAAPARVETAFAGVASGLVVIIVLVLLVRFPLLPWKTTSFLSIIALSYLGFIIE